MWHPKGQKRLKKSLLDFGFDGDILLFDEKTLRCPPHKTIPYAFKLYAIMEAKKRGYKDILWLDSSFWAVKSLDKLFEQIDKQGYSFDNAGYKVGTWTSDRCLEHMGVSREESFSMDLFSGGMIGLNMKNDVATKLLSEWFRYANDGITFPGAWYNDAKGSVSLDKRCAGHRHDMSVGSILANKLGMKINKINTFFSYEAAYNSNKNSSTELFNENVCLVCAGM